MKNKPCTIGLLGVLRHLDVEALGSIFGGDAECSQASPFSGARLSCHALRDIVDSSITHAQLRMSPNLFTTWRPGQQSLLARFGRCTRLSLELLANGDELSDEDEGEENQQPQPLLAALCFSGLEPAAAAGITHLRLTSSELQLRALAGHAIAVAGWLRNVRELELNSAIPYEDGPADNRAVYIALRAALPRLEALVLPSVGFLPGLEAFAGSGLTALRVTDNWSNAESLRMQHVRSLQQLTQISRLDISDLSGSISIECDVGQAAEAAALPGCEDDQATMAGLCKADVEQLHSLRRLLIAPPPGLALLKLGSLTVDRSLPRQPDAGNSWASGTVFKFEGGGGLVSVEVHDVHGADSLNYLAAALLPGLLLAPPGQRRLPLLRLVNLNDTAGRLREHLQPQRPLARLLALPERVELRMLGFQDDWHTDPDATAATVRAVTWSFGWPGALYLHGPHNLDFGLRFGTDCDTRRGSSGSGCDRHGAGGGVAAQLSAEAASALGDAVLHSAADRLWQGAAADGGPALVAAAAQGAVGGRRAGARKGAAAGTGAAAVAGEAPSCWHGVEAVLLLRGPLVTQQLSAGVGGAAGLKSWLDGLLLETKKGKQLRAARGARARADAAGSVAAVPAATAPGGSSGCACSVASAAGFALVQCDAPWRLVAALTAAGALVPGRLEASALLSWPFQCAWGVYIKETLESPSWYTGVLAAGADGAGAGPGAGGDTLAAAGGSVGMSGAQQQGTGEGKLEPAGDQVKLDDEELIAQLHRLVLMSGQALSKVLWAGDN
ncbi:hypothetical protein CHLRE_08g374900v5 [Chlamydomonas reinhardtii]|uniref:Uncharacterized protein n=2 Tax=Chlamydomonas reinhardtii TaxID=3055 RepID=A0A2K3DHL1_CHLRE|nr:uncharacterized protein CHLRE_08g374900v5 [Chlamydomonas reinhardtii]PNW80028.1 hypothetical protein CHLRE_08g374900v5 [Chlamydomonas reinhardtii]